MQTLARQQAAGTGTGGDEPMISVRELAHTFDTAEGQVHAVRGVSFSVRPGEFYTLLGPSGCGKTTTLRSIAGLETPTAGEILLDNEPVFTCEPRRSVPVHRRGVGMVFQSYAIWPHMTVFDNVAYPLRYGTSKRPSREQIEGRVTAVLRLVQLESMADRKATQLSGGQQQRVALARAVARGPKVLLLDEPLSNLDARLRHEMRAELKDLLTSFGTTSIYVTHDQVEALAMSDRIAVMNAGRIVQEGSPRDLYLRPRDRFVASFVGEMNLIKGVVAGASDGRVTVRTSAGPVVCVPADDRLPAGATVEVGFRPENVVLAGEGAPEPAFSVRGTLRSSTFVGDALISRVQIGDDVIDVRSHPSERAADAPTVSVSARDCIAFRTETA